MMAIKRRDLLQSFDAADAAGVVHRLLLYVNIVDCSSFDNPHAERPGLQELRTREGRRVNYLSKGRYEIVGHPMIQITSDDPNAL